MACDVVHTENNLFSFTTIFHAFSHHLERHILIFIYMSYINYKIVLLLPDWFNYPLTGLFFYSLILLSFSSFSSYGQSNNLI